VHLALVICQGVGLAAAAGLRPFLPGLLAGALAAANLGIDFDHTSYAFLEQPPFLFVLFVGLAASVALVRRSGVGAVEGGVVGSMIAGAAIGVGALLFAGSLADEHQLAWPGLIAGVLCAAVAQAAARSLLGRTRARLDAAAAAALPLYADGAGLALAGLSVLAPPLGVVGLAFFAWLLVTGRRRAGRKYAGLRILR